MAAQNPFQAILDAVIKDGAELAQAYVNAHQTELLAEAAKLETTAVDAVVTFVVNALPKNGIWVILGPEVAKAIEAAAPQIVAALGGENQALLAFIQAELAKLVANP